MSNLATIEIPVDDVRGDPGTRHVISITPTEFPGQNCDVLVHSLNNDSVHLGTILDVDGILIPGVEDQPGPWTVEASQNLTLNGEVTVAVILGPDGVFSGGLEVEITCPPVTTTSVPETTTSVPESSTTIPITTLSTQVTQPTTSSTIPASSSVPETSTSLVPTPVLEVQPTTTISTEGSATELPNTGMEAELGIAGATFLTLGAIFCVVARRLRRS